MLRARLPNVALNWLRDIMYPQGKTGVMATSQAAMVNLAMALAHGDGEPCEVFSLTSFCYARPF